VEDLEQIEDDEHGAQLSATKGHRDRGFNPWRFAATERAQAVVREAIGSVERYEHHRAPRKRNRKSDDQKTFELTVEAVLCDLINHTLVGFPKGVFITRSGEVLSNRSRYKAPALNKRLPDLLDKLASPELAWIDQRKGQWSWTGDGARTVIKPGWRLLDGIEQGGLKSADIGVRPHGEVIYLREPRTDTRAQAKLLEYEDTPETELYRAQMQRINEWLASADIGFDDSLLLGKKVAVDDRERKLWRSFTRQRFDSGGRLFGGFWMPLNKKQREAAIIIEGEDIVELDYGQMAPRLLYARKHLQPPEKDLYAVPGFKRERAGIKKVMNAMIFAQKPLTRMPRGVRKKFEESCKVDEVTAAIETYHPDIADLFYRGIGHEAQFTESQIMVDILLRLIDMEIIALPIHDALLVRSSDEDEAKDVMLDVFRDHTGIEGLVD
jgi:hypothetical protein